MSSQVARVALHAAASAARAPMLAMSWPETAAHGSAATAGVLLSSFAAGSWIGAFLYGLRPRSRPAGHQYPSLCLLAGLGLAPLILTPTLLAMVPLAVLSGLCYAPITSQMAVIDEVAQPEHKAEAFTWLGTLYGTGLADGRCVRPTMAAADIDPDQPRPVDGTGTPRPAERTTAA